ncbi:MAG: ketopantoate reductase family protein [Promethearchaeota archaeon]
MINMRILLIGPGSIGGLFAGKLALTGNRILIYAHQDFSQFFKKNIFLITDIDKKDYVVPNLQLAPSYAEFLKLKPYELPEICLISVKSSDLEKICIEYKEILEKINYLGLIQNGIENEEILRNYFPNSVIFRIITSHGAMKETQTHIIHTGIGKTSICQIYPLFEELPSDKKRILIEFSENLQKSGFKNEINKDPIESIWRKAFTNIGINAIGAITRLTNGELLKSEFLSDLIRKTINEAILIAKALNIQLDPSFDYVENAFEILKNTATNKNSMLQDVLREKRTEIEFLNCKITNYGKKLNVQTPLNQILSELILGLEKSFGIL